MRIYIYIDTLKKHHIEPAKLFKEGLKRHGIEGLILSPRRYQSSDLAVFWGRRFPEIIKNQAANDLDCLTMEMGYVGDRRENISLGFNGLNGRADFVTDELVNDRTERFKDNLKPWKKSGEYYVVMGQVPGDMSIAHANFDHWRNTVIAKLKELGKPYIYRPHPLCVANQEPLKEALKNAKVVITFNSNSGVDAALAGIPVVTYDEGSMAYDVSTHDVSSNLKRPDRAEWFNKLCHSQWTKEEIGNGEAWEHLRKRYE